MDDVNEVMRDDIMMNIDLNLDPDGSRVGLRPLISELETAHDQIEDRVRRLEEVTSRLRQRQTLLQSQTQTPDGSDVVEVRNTGLGGNETEVHNGESGVGSETNVQRGRSCKRDYSQLVARALEDESDVKKDVSDGGSFYDCKICLEMAKDPVLTCCGHLFCWACFYRLEYVDLTAKECPVCRGDVIDSNVTPIYGSVNSSHISDSGSGVCIPPRPRAYRVESIRQRVNRPVSHVPVAEALRRIRMGIGATAEQLRQQQRDNTTAEHPRQQNFGSATAVIDLQPLWMTAEIGGSQRNNATSEQPGQQNFNRSNAGSVTEWQPLWRDAEIGGGRRNNVTAQQLREQNLDSENAGSVTDMQPLLMTAEIGGSRRSDATTEQPRQQSLDRENTGFVTDLQLWQTEEIGDLQRDNPTVEQGRQQHLDNPSDYPDLQPFWITAEIGGSRSDSATAERSRQQNLDNTTAGSLTGLEPLWMNAEIRARRRLRSRQFSRVLSETAASLSSISFALNNTERLVENLESFIRVLNVQRTDSQLMEARDLLSNSVAVIQTELQSLNSTAETNLVPDASAAVASLENPETDSSVSDHLSVPRPLSSRRSSPSMVSDTENDVPRESQRRRMR